MIQRIEESNSFSINTSDTKGSIDAAKVGKIFQLLSNLYSDEQAVILQELVANAHDSYKRIGKKGIVTIEYDNVNKSLHIIDEAEGISPYAYNTYITKLGSSSKEDEVDSAGTLGIGAYSSWCVTDTFYLTTVYNGIKYYYSCFKEDYCEPEFCLLMDQPTDECNGTDYWFYTKYSYSFGVALSKLRYFENVVVKGFSFNNDYKIIHGKTFLFNSVYPSKELEICFA